MARARAKHGGAQGGRTAVGAGLGIRKVLPGGEEEFPWQWNCLDLGMDSVNLGHSGHLGEAGGGRRRYVLVLSPGAWEECGLYPRLDGGCCSWDRILSLAYFEGEPKAVVRRTGLRGATARIWRPGGGSPWHPECHGGGWHAGAVWVWGEDGFTGTSGVASTRLVHTQSYPTGLKTFWALI